MGNNMLWDPGVWNDLVDESKIKQKPIKRDLTKKVEFPSEFNGLRVPLDAEMMVSLGDNEYSKVRLPTMLSNSIAGYVGKEKEEVDFMDLIQMYLSINEVLDEGVENKNLKKWRKANKDKVSRFGMEQYGLMKNYFDAKMP